MKLQKLMVWALVMLMAGAGAAWATDYTWKNNWNQNWSDANQWTPAGGPPGASDSASITNLAYINIATGSRAAQTVTATGTNHIRWVQSANTLTIGAGNLNYNASNSFDGIKDGKLSSFEAILAGTGGLRVNAGALRINNAANSYSGGVEVNGGILLNGPVNPWDRASSSDLGWGGIIIGSGTAGSNDATVLVGGGDVAANYVTNAITIRAGNDGVARLGSWHSGGPWTYAYLKGPVTMGKALTFVNDEEWNIIKESYHTFTREYLPLYVDGGVGGSGNLTKEGLGVIAFRGTNTYTGTTTIRGGTTYILGTNNSNTGNFTVEYGTLIVATNPSLGAVGNTLTLGGSGTFGAFGTTPYTGSGNYPLVPLPHAITLAGNGGILTARGLNPRPQLDGKISGSGRLILASASAGNLRTPIHGNNDYTGGTIANNGVVDIVAAGALNNTVYGSGDVWVLRDGYLFVRGVNNINASAKVRVDWPARIAVPIEYVPNLTTNSDGILAFGGTSGATIHNRLGDGANPLGNGKVWLGVAYGYDFIYGGWSLAALVANDPTRTYRIGYGYGWVVDTGSRLGGYIELNATNTVTQGALRDLNGNPHHVVIAEDVRLYDHNPFTGTLTVEPGASCSAYLPDATGNPLGSDSGIVRLNSAVLAAHNTAFTTRTVSKGDIVYSGSCGLRLNAASSAPPWYNSTFSVTGLQRQDRSTLAIHGERGYLGSPWERILVGGGVLSNNGMVAPYLWNLTGLCFLDYVGGVGFTNSTWTKTDLTGVTGTDRVNLAGGAAVPAGGVELYALRSGGALTGGAVTNLRGALILTGATITHTAPMDFGTNEAVVYATAANTLSGRLTGSGGLTKSGAGTLTLLTDNTGSLTGGFTVNEGTLSFTNWVHLGGVANTITLNGGTLSPANMDAAIVTNDIVLGNLGGTLLGGRYSGNISGTGTLTLKDYRTYVLGINNTYTGGTLVPGYGSGNQLSIAANSSLGPSGTVTVWNAYTEWGNSRAGLILNGDGNLTAAHRLILNSFNSFAMFRSASPVVGSIEGNGTISFGTDAIAATLRVGGNNLSTDYFGLLSDADYFSVARTGLDLGRLVKEGTGTLTLWGESWYRGGTIVSNGTLCVNNWMNPVGTVVVKPGATLDGIGTVGIVSNLGGTVKGNLYMRRLAMDSASTNTMTLSGTNALSQYSQLNVTEGLTLGGSTLNLTLGFAPAVGQSFTLVNNTSSSPITGQFAQGRVINVSYNGVAYAFSINYAGGDGNDIVLTVMPRGTILLIR